MYIHSTIGCFHDHAHHLFKISFWPFSSQIIILIRQYMHSLFIFYGFSLFWDLKDITLVLGFPSKLNWLLFIDKWFVKLLQFIACSVATLPHALIHVVCLHVSLSSSLFRTPFSSLHFRGAMDAQKFLSSQSFRGVIHKD